MLYGDAGQPFDGNRELDRSSAIQSRRDAALRAAQQALKSGDAGQTAKTADELAKQEERYRKQAELLKTNGVDVGLQSEGAVARVAEQVDRLGIQYDREAEALKAKQETALTESQTASTFNIGADKFTVGTEAFAASVDGFEQQAKTLAQSLLDFSPSVGLPDTEPLDTAFDKFDSTTTRLLEELGKPIKVEPVRIQLPETARQAAQNTVPTRKLTPEEFAASEKRWLKMQADAGVIVRNEDTGQVFYDAKKEYQRIYGPVEAAAATLAKETDRQSQLAFETKSRADRLAADIAFALRPNANTVQRAVNESLSKIRNITPLFNPGSAQTGGRTVNNNQRFDLTINVPAGSAPDDIGQAVRREITNMNREADIFGGC